MIRMDSVDYIPLYSIRRKAVGVLYTRANDLLGALITHVSYAPKGVPRTFL